MNIKDCGIYQIKNLITNLIYIGSSVKISKRWKDHKRLLSENKHHSAYLQSAWIKYGSDAFEFKVLELCSKETIMEREQYWIDNSICLAPNGYNILPRARTRLGSKHTEATLVKLRAKKISEAHKKQLSEKHKGRKHSAETRAKMSVSQRKKKCSEETKERMRQAWVKRRNFPEIINPIIIGNSNGST